MIPDIEWPPVYKVKKHKRARRVKLYMSKRGLEITVPFRFNLKEIPTLLEEHKTWITQQCLQSQIKKSAELPTELHFRAVNQWWRIYYDSCQTKWELIERPCDELVLVGSMADKKSGQEKLLAWIKKKSKIYLTGSLEEISKKTQLSYHKVTIRDQHTVWGSCTSKKSINLNYKLIFLPKPLVDYVMIHELCHTKHLNHSEKFWNLVAFFDPHWKQHRQELRHANQFIPDL